ncbi:recombinase family protein [Streptomyces sp. H27-D2]|uniref:recombinase family protein n=1 Tax=Streptomyces sp. H27-D2 TaxID=3046304 RepID=UPI002DB61EFD|nr:recombinase family protein [Streptomyces sp. H27-D2]MEC4017020.1 recombinase family protein [Streptomyces sp. H27-D2]
MAKPKRVGIYVRISKDRKGQELGIQRQEKACRELCERLGWGVLKIYPENDISASTTSKRQRPEYTEMLRDARDGLIDAVVVYSIDRLTRRIAELTNFLEQQQEHGFAFATTEGEDTATANGRMILTIKGAVAQQETERMSERINSSLLQRREKGKPHAGGPRVFGFEPGSNFRRVVPDELELIRLGYRMLMDQKTPGDVARAWNEHGSRSSGGETAWAIQKVKRVYRSERLGGIVSYKGQDIGDSIYPHPLTREEWENVQTILNVRSTPAKKGSGKRKHLYSGFLKCGHCGSTMRIQWATILGRTFRRSFCHSGQVGAHGELGCGKVSRSYAWIEERLNEVVEAALAKRMPKPQTAPSEDLSGEIKILEERIRGLRNRWKADEMEDEDYFDSLKHLRAELQALHTRTAASVVRESRTETDALAVWRDEDMQNLERRRAIVASAIKHVEVFSVGRGRKKPPEIDSIKVTPVGAEPESPEA